jgi:hypothetical protein
LTYKEFVLKYKNPSDLSVSDLREGAHYLRPVFDLLDAKAMRLFVLMVKKAEQIGKKEGFSFEKDTDVTIAVQLTALCVAISNQGCRDRNFPSPTSEMKRLDYPSLCNIKIIPIKNETDKINNPNLN